MTYKGKAVMYAQDHVIRNEKNTLYWKIDVFLKSKEYNKYKLLFNCDESPNIHVNAGEKFYVILSNKDV
jgi:hypothetical protein